MPICEKCGAAFQSSGDVVEVTSTRVLCPSCAAERRAEKARLAATRSAQRPAAPGAAPSPAANARPPTPVPAQPPARPRPAAAAQASGAQAAAARPARPAGAPAPALRPSPPRRAEPPPEPAAAPERRPRTSARAAAATARQKGKAGGESDSERERFIRREADLIKQKENQVVMIGWGAALLLAVVAAVVVFIVKGKKDAEREAREVRQEAIDTFQATFMAIDISTVQGANKAVGLAEEQKKNWEDTDNQQTVLSKLAKAKNKLKEEEDLRDLQARLEAVEAVVRNPASQTVEQLAESRRRTEELEQRSSFAQTTQPEFVARVGAARNTLDRIFADRLFEEAKAEARGTNGRAALAKFAQAEDEVYKIFERAVKAQNKEKDAVFRALYRSIIDAADAHCDLVFTPEAIEQTPWRDLLATEAHSSWKAAAVKGFEHSLSPGSLHLRGGDPDAAAFGIISVGDAEKWRDFLLDFELTLVKGKITVFLRLGPSADSTVEGFDISTESDEGVVPGQKYSVEVRIVGSLLKYHIRSDEFSLVEHPVSWTKVRKGAVGIQVPDGTEVKFSRFRVKVLR